MVSIEGSLPEIGARLTCVPESIHVILKYIKKVFIKERYPIFEYLLIPTSLPTFCLFSFIVWCM